MPAFVPSSAPSAKAAPPDPVPRAADTPDSAAAPRTALGGIGLMVMATFVFAAQDAITKSLASTLPIGQIVFVRFVAFLAFALVFAARGAGVRAALRSSVPRVQVLRCTLMVSEIALFAWALRYLGIAEIHALFACFPLVVAALSVPVLGERVGPLRWAAVGVGLAGTLIILRPGSSVFDAHALMPLACAIIYALYNLLTRRVSKVDSFATSLVYFGLVGTLASSVFAALQWQPVSGPEAWKLAALCATSVAAHIMLIRALQLTEAVVLQPFHYLVLPWAIVIGAVVYGERLEAATLVGAAVVVASGTFVAWREYVAARRRGGSGTSARRTASPETSRGSKR